MARYRFPYTVKEIDDLLRRGAGGLSVDITIPATGWDTDSDPDFPWYYDYELAGVTASTIADLTLDATNQIIAYNNSYSDVTETLEGVVRFRAMMQPTVAVSGRLDMRETHYNE